MSEGNSSLSDRVPPSDEHSTVAAPPMLEVRDSTADKKPLEGRWFLLPVDASRTIVPWATVDNSRDGHRPTVEGARATADRFALAWNCHDDLLAACHDVLGLAQLLLARDDLPLDVRESLAHSHRIGAVRAAIAKAGALT